MNELNPTCVANWGLDVVINAPKPITTPLPMPYKKLLRKHGICATSRPKMYSDCNRAHRKERKWFLDISGGNRYQRQCTHLGRTLFCFIIVSHFLLEIRTNFAYEIKCVLLRRSVFLSEWRHNLNVKCHRLSFGHVRSDYGFEWNKIQLFIFIWYFSLILV